MATRIAIVPASALLTSDGGQKLRLDAGYYVGRVAELEERVKRAKAALKRAETRLANAQAAVVAERERIAKLTYPVGEI